MTGLKVANADAFISCWTVQEANPFTGEVTSTTHCQLADGTTATFEGDEPPGVLQPNVGTDATGTCWYWTSFETDWTILTVEGNGDAILGLYINGFLAVDTGLLRRCTSPPVEVDPPSIYAWEAVTDYVHDPPSPELNPPIGDGLAGLDTYLASVVPGPWADTITIPGFSIDVEVTVDLFTVDWGDESETSYPADTYSQLTGYPDGVAFHTYELKTCTPAGSAVDCHPTLEAYPVTIAYDWAARWRVNAGPWLVIDVPPSTTTVDYPVTEIVSTLTETG